MRVRVATVLGVFMFAVFYAVATAQSGWFTVVSSSVAAGFVGAFQLGHLSMMPPRRLALAAALGWGGLLAFAARGGRLPAVMTMVGDIVGQPGAVVLGLTLLLPAVLAWASATVGGSIGAALRRRLGGPPAADPITLRAPGPTSRPGDAADAAPGSTAAATP